jgi:hypothetical protein
MHRQKKKKVLIHIKNSKTLSNNQEVVRISSQALYPF